MAENLADIAAEYAEEEAQQLAEEEANAPVDKDAPIQMDEQGMTMMVAPMIAGLGAVICKRAHVTGLDQSEVDALTNSVVGVAALYDFQMAPKTAAWLGLGMTGLAIVGNREPLPMSDAVTPENDNEPEAANENKPDYMNGDAPDGKAIK